MGACDLPLVREACGAAGAAKAVVDFAKDPLGYIAQKLQEGAAGLANTVLPAVVKATQPDLSAAWFRDAYEISFGLSLFVFVAFLGWNFVQLARRRVSGDEVAETLGFYTPLFFGGVLFGPVLGAALLSLVGALLGTKDVGLIHWGVAGSVDGTTGTLQTAIAAGDPGKMAGGAIVAIVIFFCLIVALLLVVVALLVMLATLYLTGALLPLSLVWLVQPRQRAKGLKLVTVWVGILFSQVLLFLLLGMAFRMVGGLTTFSDPALQTLVNLVVAVIVLLMATLAPLGLLKFAPVGPSVAPDGPGLSIPRQRAGSSYPESDGDSQTAQLARDTSSADSAGGDSDDLGSSDPGGTSSGGGLSGKLADLRAGRGGTAEPPAVSGAEAPSTAGEAGGGETSTSTGTAADQSNSGAGVIGARSADDGPSGTPSSTGEADGAASSLTGAGMTAAGPGGSSGVADAGAAAAGGGAMAGLAVASAALSRTAELAQSAGELAGEQMQHGEPDSGGGAGADARSRR